MQMTRNSMDEAISAFKVAPAQLLGMCVSTVAALCLFATESKWWGIASMISVIFTGLMWMSTPGIIQAANNRAKACHRYQY